MKITRKETQIQDEEELEKIIDDADKNIIPQKRTINPDYLIPSGLTLLNCACSDTPFGGFLLGTINTIPGKSMGGKTMLMSTMMACCANEKRFDEYELINDDAEHSYEFDTGYLFPNLVDRLKAPQYDKNIPKYSQTIQDFQNNILTFCKSNKRFIYCLDSLDSLSSTEELEREYKNALKAAKVGDDKEKIAKSYHMEKAKHTGEMLRMIKGPLKENRSSLFIVQQTRQRTDRTFGGQTDWVTSGGEAPLFYSFHQIYITAVSSHSIEKRGIKNKIGSHNHVAVMKNKLTGKKRTIQFDIFDDLGVDDTSGMVEFLIKTEHWKKDGNQYHAPEILGEDKMFKKDLVYLIEKEGMIKSVQEIVGKIWNEVENEMRLSDRQRRF